jgi:hypothetical protein
MPSNELVLHANSLKNKARDANKKYTKEEHLRQQKKKMVSSFHMFEVPYEVKTQK